MDVNELDVYKLKTVPIDLNKLINSVKVILLKRLYMMN